jgi:hypothetical protein
VWSSREAGDFTCEQCGSGFESSSLRRPRFCSNKCKTASRLASGVDNEQRECGWCGDEYTINRYYKARCCSNTCAQRLRRRGSPGLQSDG